MRAHGTDDDAVTYFSPPSLSLIIDAAVFRNCAAFTGLYLLTRRISKAADTPAAAAIALAAAHMYRRFTAEYQDVSASGDARRHLL